MAICTYNARTLASEAAIEDLMMQAKKIKYDVIGLTETRRRHPLKAVYETGEELFLGTCDSRGVGAQKEKEKILFQTTYESSTTEKKILYGPKIYHHLPRRTPEELHIGTHGLHWNDQGERLSEFIMTIKTIHGNSQFQKPSSLR
ncbi:hypothetical protein RB195_005934 [Necator americanus]|uniref:Endonuclease/exonuclease/phosphatase domain-containing protein n=1 Tax=Necator americanus TaxID=51031 RepID=A0ABR1BQ93_NECAM